MIKVDFMLSEEFSLVPFLLVKKSELWDQNSNLGLKRTYSKKLSKEQY